MYNRYFGLKESPFALAPDPRYLYLSRRHQEALAHLIFGVTEGGGFVQLTGDVGTGKTMLIRALLERLPSHVDVALILYPILSVREFVSTICDELRIPYAKEHASLKVLIDALNYFLLENHAKGRRSVLVIDEAQNLNRDVLEQLRLLTNLETRTEKLLQILLVGQPELDNMLAQSDLRQLAQRITARYSLESLFPHETSDYIVHRCHVAGAKTQLFSRGAMRVVHRCSTGIPRLINTVCDRALLGAYARGRLRANGSIVRRAAAQVGVRVHPRVAWPVGMAVAAALTTAAIAVGWQFLPQIEQRWQSNTTTASVQPDATPAQSVQPPGATPAASPPPRAERTDGDARAGKGSQPTLAQLLADPSVPTDTESALAGLFAHWGLDYSKLPGETGCDRALKSGLRCLLQSGTWNNLRHLNRPAVIELLDASGGRHHVLVSGLDGDEVVSELGGRQYTFPISEVDRYWYGQYLMLWKPPLQNQQVLRVGMRGESVLWLRNTLARYSGQPSTAKNNVFDRALEAQVKQFQRDHHLDDDGIVGKLTLMQLNTYDPQMMPPVLWKAAKARTS